MKLSKFSDYSFRALIYLAHHQNTSTTVENLSDDLDISIHHMKKIINKLANNNYVITTKGRNGGLRLARNPEEINLGELLLLTEDNLQLLECFSETHSCPFDKPSCKLKQILAKSKDTFITECKKYHLNDIL